MCDTPLNTTTLDIHLHANLADYDELEITNALARHSVEMGLPKQYA